MKSANLCSLAGRYDNPVPIRFLAPIDCLKIPALAGRYDNPNPTRRLAPIDFLKIPAQARFSVTSLYVMSAVQRTSMWWIRIRQLKEY
jgi:hypothetical protein